ncbi:uncharacterized protein YjdB [Enterococcus sp. PF1-24]|uniref:Ig-like domain-containing protein n=1 Tax=unclassified Enterococcus TaxID=2608891 RepID=UPI00247630EF|nr:MULTISPECIES: Ig-like domain-containing protein [unclassified Enterococcus]MDH6363254.1 uncharacterized protein YjdB [Enterococcus sp. PFB1-1]MDH6400445.1 uncharacterized protein YjdB [Enterococcus sp. PF1-24]
MKLKKLGLLSCSVLLLSGAFAPSVVALANEPSAEIMAQKDNEELNEVLKGFESKKIIDNFLEEGYLEKTDSGELEVTEAYVAETQKEIGNDFVVSAEGNMLLITPKSARVAVPAGGVTGIIFEGTVVKLYLSQSICDLILNGSTGLLKGLIKTIVSLIPGAAGIGEITDVVIDFIVNSILTILGATDIKNGIVISFGITATFPFIVFDISKQENDSSGGAEDVKVSKLKIHPDAKELFVDEEWQLLPEFTPSNPSNRDLKWSSNNVDIVTVDANTGLIKTKKAGTAVITAVTQDGTAIEAKATITVKNRTVHANDVTVTPSYRELPIGQTEKFEATVSPEDAANKNVKWSSSDEKIAKVDETGKVTAIAEGVATITVTTEDGGKTGTAVVKVGPKIISVESIKVTPKTKEMKIGDTQLLDATISPANASNQTYTWSSDTPEVATVSSKGLVTAKKAGYALITATTKDGNKIGTCIVNVKKEEPVIEKSVAMLRMYNPNSGEHFYTANPDEKNVLVDYGWRYEGIGWYAPEKGAAVYRMYNPNSGDHHYTLNVVERDNLVFTGWEYEGIGWYSDVNKSVALYRSYNPNAKTGNHNYTTVLDEHKNLLNLGWRDEGIGWYGV